MNKCIVACGLIGIGGCSVIPPMPDDFSLTVREILQHSACELRGAFVELSKPQYASFKANKWLIAVKLTPKTDGDVNGALRLNGNNTSLSAAKTLYTPAADAPRPTHV